MGIWGWIFKAQGLAAGKILQHILAFRLSIFRRIPVGGNTHRPLRPAVTDRDQQDRSDRR
jgi:hypothetical protein